MVALALAGPAAATDTICDAKYSNVCCHNMAFLSFTWTYKSGWTVSAGFVYDQRRYRSDGTLAYNERVTADGNEHWFLNSVDAYRETALYLNDSGSTAYIMRQIAMGHC